MSSMVQIPELTPEVRCDIGKALLKYIIASEAVLQAPIYSMPAANWIPTWAPQKHGSQNTETLPTISMEQSMLLPQIGPLNAADVRDEVNVTLKQIGGIDAKIEEEGKQPIFVRLMEWQGIDPKNIGMHQWLGASATGEGQVQANPAGVLRDILQSSTMIE